MELDEMKSLWEDMSIELESQKKLTGSLVLNMRRINYRHQLNKIIIPETIGALVGFAGVFFILANFQKLDSWYIQACGIISAVILFILPVLSLRALSKIRAINIGVTDFKQTLLAYAKGRMQFVFVQKLSFYLGALLLVTSLPVMVELMGGADPFKKGNIWFAYIIMYPFFHVFVRWVFKRYMKITADAEEMLREIGE